MSKFNIGDKVIVCDELKTVIENIETVDAVDIYWFRDNDNKLWQETENAIEKDDNII